MLFGVRTHLGEHERRDTAGKKQQLERKIITFMRGGMRKAMHLHTAKQTYLHRITKNNANKSANIYFNQIVKIFASDIGMMRARLHPFKIALRHQWHHPLISGYVNKARVMLHLNAHIG